MSTLPFSMLPAEDPQTSPDDQVAAAVAGALALPTGLQQPVPDPPEQPFGRSWIFDFEAGQFVWAGESPADTFSLFGALEQWCLMAIHSARYAYPCFTDEFGMEDPDSLQGHFAEGELLVDWQAHLVDALMVHDRITSVENFDMDWDPTVGVLTINSFDVITDEDQTVTVSDVTLKAGGLQ